MYSESQFSRAHGCITVILNKAITHQQSKPIRGYLRTQTGPVSAPLWKLQALPFQWWMALFMAAERLPCWLYLNVNLTLLFPQWSLYRKEWIFPFRFIFGLSLLGHKVTLCVSLQSILVLFFFYLFISLLSLALLFLLLQNECENACWAPVQ